MDQVKTTIVYQLLTSHYSATWRSIYALSGFFSLLAKIHSFTLQCKIQEQQNVKAICPRKYPPNLKDTSMYEIGIKTSNSPSAKLSSFRNRRNSAVLSSRYHFKTVLKCAFLEQIDRYLSMQVSCFNACFETYLLKRF